ncbi:hypothetical protein Hanom_Chr08g00703351 [Helianthus anomalus]
MKMKIWITLKTEPICVFYNFKKQSQYVYFTSSFIRKPAENWQKVTFTRRNQKQTRKKQNNKRLDKIVYIESCPLLPRERSSFGSIFNP